MENNSTSLPVLNFSDSGRLNDSPVTLVRGLVGALMYLTVFVTILGNSLVLLVVAQYKRLQTVFNMYVVNLAITDVLVAITAMTFYSTAIMLDYWPFGQVMCGIWVFCDYGMTFASCFTHMAISVDRFWAVKWSLHYKRTNTKKKALIAITLIWISMLILWLPPCIIDRLANSQPDICIWEPSKNREFVVVIAVLGHHGSCVTILFCYVSVLVVIRQRARVGFFFNKAELDEASVFSPSTVLPSSQRSDQRHVLDSSTAAAVTTLQYISPESDTQVEGSQSTGPKSKNTEEMATTGTNQGKGVKFQHTTENQTQDRQVVTSREAKAFVTLSCIVFSYVICWVPFHFVYDISAIAPDNVSDIVFKVTFWMTYLNSAINPILYGFFGKDFKLAFKGIFTRRARVKVHPQV